MNLYTQFQILYNQLKQTDEQATNKYKLHLMERVEEYIRNGTYTTARHKDVLFPNLDYPTLLIAQSTGLSVSTLNKTRNDIFEDLDHHLFDELFSSLKRGTWQHSETLLAMMQKLDEIDQNDLLNKLKARARTAYRRTGRTSVQQISVSDCGREIQMLRSLSSDQLAIRINKMGFEQMVRFIYVLQVIDKNKGTSTDRQAVIQLLTE